MAVPKQTDFLLGWICILGKEYSAAKNVLDKTYGTNEKLNFVSGNGDTNKYQLGRIQNHDVVINIPKSGTSGQIPAYQIATNMKSTFPCIRYILLVGIGGGAPSTKSDVRLGDVVIGTSVCQYRKGKILDRLFKPISHRETPPGELLGAVTELVDEIWGGKSLQQIMDDMFLAKNNLREMYPRPTDDRLLLRDYLHNDRCVCLQQQLDDGAQMVNREERAAGELIKIHTGTIGSSDAVMKCARERDRVSHQEEIVCFEMEAAAVMQSTRSISIRGISDYSDGHKNDVWHDYAALTAAVCAKELLRWLTPKSVSRATMVLTSDELERIIQGRVEEVCTKLSQSLRGNENPKMPIGDANERLIESLGFLECFTRHPTQDNKMATAMLMSSLQKKLQGSVHDLQTEVDKQATSSDYVRRAEWEELKHQVNNTAKEVDDWGKTCQKILDAASELAQHVADHVGDKHSKFVPKYLKSGSKFVGIFNDTKGSSKKNEFLISNCTHIGVPYQASAPPTVPSEGSSQGRPRSDRSSNEQPPKLSYSSNLSPRSTPRPGGQPKAISYLSAPDDVPWQSGSDSPLRQNSTVTTLPVGNSPSQATNPPQRKPPPTPPEKPQHLR